MTPYELAAWFNVASIALIIAVSLLILSRYPSPFFRSWVFAVTGAIVPSIGEAIAPHVGRPLWLVLIGAAGGLTSGYFLIHTARLLTGRGLPRWGYPVYVGLGLAWAAGAVAMGLEHPVPVLPAVFSIVGGFIYMGVRLLVQGRRSGRPGLRWYGVPMVIYSLWLISYPAVTDRATAWLGFSVSALLLLIVGVGVVIYWLEEVALELQAKNEQLEQLDAMKRNFVSRVSHELRTPLMVVVGNAELLEDGSLGPLGDRQAASAKDIRQAAEHLSELVDTIVDTFQLEAGALRLKREALALATVLDEALGPLQGAIQRKGLALKLAVPVDLPAVWADPFRVMQIVNELVSNALKFSQPGDTIEIEALGHPDRVEVRVHDSGIGIPPAKRKAIFEPFYQGDASLTRRHGGVGLGLSLVRELVVAMEGQIAVQSREPRGSTFCFTLPRVDAPSQAFEAPLV